VLRKRCRLDPPLIIRPCERQPDGGWVPGDRGAPEGVLKAAFTDLPRPGPSTLRCDLATLLIDTIEADCYPMSPRVGVLKDILTKFGELGGLSPELAQRLRR